MAVRIYALAKELKLDSKILVDICAKAGVTGKGSALASLTDDEAAKVKAFVSGGGAKAPAAPAAPAAVKVAVGAGVATAEAPVFRREDYIPPAGVGSKPPVIGAKPAREKEREREKDETPRRGEGGKPPRTGPAIRVAPLPTASQPPPTAPAEPEPQRPDIKLPVDVIRAGKMSSRPLQQHVQQHEERRRAAEELSKAKGGARAPAEPGADKAGEARGRKPAKPGGKGPGEGDTGLSWREQRQINRKKHAAEGRGAEREDEDAKRVRRPRIPFKRTGTNTAAPRKGKVAIELPCTVRSFSEAMGVPVRAVISKLMSLGTMATINAELDAEMVELLAAELGVEVDLKQPLDLEARLLESIQQQVDEAESLVPRPPVVTFLGHVDHGKTSLLDRIIGIDVAAGESGGITQHIRAYRIDKDGRSIAFVDTPGHEAFTEMRARGANVTDIAVLVVAADDGVMPQTEEAISHARAAGVPIVVALNKVDLPGINFDRIYTQLVTSGLQPTEWGGDTELVRCSALTGEGIDTLLETLLTIAELQDYRANPARPGYGTCLEAELHEDRGVVAKVLVQSGTLRLGDVIVCGAAHGRVKAMYDTLDPRKMHEAAGPGTPVNLTGLDVVPGAGDRFYVLEDIAEAREIAEKRSQQARRAAISGAAAHVTLETLHERLGGEEAQTLNLILRADTRGSIEAIQKELTKLEHPEVKIRVLQATVGGVTEADVHLADASDAVIIGFNVVPDEGARNLAEQRGVQIRRYDIIYQVTDDLRAALEGMLKPEQRQVELGRALVQKTFSISRLGTIAGCRVLAGQIERNARVRVIRDSRVVGDYPLESLKREKDDAREVREGYECGMKLAGFNDIKEGDILEAYRIEEFARTL